MHGRERVIFTLSVRSHKAAKYQPIERNKEEKIVEEKRASGWKN